MEEWLNTKIQQMRRVLADFTTVVAVDVAAVGLQMHNTIDMESKKIQTRNLFAGNLARIPYFATLVAGRDYRVVGALPNTGNIMSNAFWIGHYPGMSNDKLDYMIAKIKEF